MRCQCSSSKPVAWRFGERIGQGSYGCVYKAQNTETGEIFAVKKAWMEDADRDCCRKLELELGIFKDVRHPNIINYLGYEHADNQLYLFLEYAPGGSMASILAEFGPLREQLLRKATGGMLEGLNYLHTHNPPVVHRDIKGANVLVGQDFCVKLTDFGCSKIDTLTQSRTIIGSIPWMAPEVIRQEDGHGRKADVWSLGCTVLEMATAEKPWGKDRFDNIMSAFKHIGLSDELPPIPEAMHRDGRDLALRCLARRPEERPHAGELLAHEFVEGSARGGCA